MLFQSRRRARSDHGRCSSVADHLEAPGEPLVYRAVGAGVFSRRCATRQFLVRSASLDDVSFYRVVLRRQARSQRQIGPLAASDIDSDANKPLADLPSHRARLRTEWMSTGSSDGRSSH